MENVYTSSEGSSHSSLKEEQTVNRVEEGESGEKHMYHVLEKPGGDIYDEIDKNLEENTAMEYETPAPLNELYMTTLQAYNYTLHYTCLITKFNREWSPYFANHWHH